MYRKVGPWVGSLRVPICEEGAVQLGFDSSTVLSDCAQLTGFVLLGVLLCTLDRPMNSKTVSEVFTSVCNSSTHCALSLSPLPSNCHHQSPILEVLLLEIDLGLTLAILNHHTGVDLEYVDGVFQGCSIESEDLGHMRLVRQRGLFSSCRWPRWCREVAWQYP